MGSGDWFFKVCRFKRKTLLFSFGFFFPILIMFIYYNSQNYTGFSHAAMNVPSDYIQNPFYLTASFCFVLVQKKISSRTFAPITTALKWVMTSMWISGGLTSDTRVRNLRIVLKTHLPHCLQQNRMSSMRQIRCLKKGDIREHNLI